MLPKEPLNSAEKPAKNGPIKKTGAPPKAPPGQTVPSRQIAPQRRTTARREEMAIPLGPQRPVLRLPVPNKDGRTDPKDPASPPATALVSAAAIVPALRAANGLVSIIRAPTALIGRRIRKTRA